MSESPLKYIDFQEAVQLVTSRLSDYQPMRLYKEGIKSSAVMILLLNKIDVPHILFTKRTNLVETHKGQISFPGGVADPSDKSLLHTALRETHEEIGLGSNIIESLGRLDDFYTVTDFIVTPFAGFINSPFEYKINESEVAEILEVPLSLFLMDQNFEVKKWDYQGTFYDVYFYYHGRSVIWGATAFILNRFIHHVFGFNPAPNPVSEDPRNLHYLRENKVRKGSR